MTALAPLPKDHPIMIAWEKYKASDQYANAFQWAQNVDHRDGSMWSAFLAGFDASYSKPLSPAPVGVTDGEHLPTRDEAAAAARILSRCNGFDLDEWTQGNWPVDADDWLRPLASHEPAPADTQEGVSEAGKVVAWMHPTSSWTSYDRSVIYKHCRKDGSDGGPVPLVRLSALTACQQEVERLREFERQHDYCCCGSRMEDHNIGSGHSPVSMYDYEYARAVNRAEAAEARIAELVKALEPFAEIADSYSDQEDDDFQVWTDFDVIGATLPLRIFRRARATLGGQSNG